MRNGSSCAPASPERRAGGGIVVAIAALALLVPAAAPAQRSPLTAAPQLATAYNAIFDARFEDVPALLDATCSGRQPPAQPAAPRRNARRADPARPAERAAPEVCQLLDILSVWWQIQLDPVDTSRDPEFASGVDAAIAAIDAWTRRQPERAEAWFYLGGAYGARAQWRVLRGERIAAARDGKRIKDALERALALDPALQDAYFGIGLYHYYADVAPTAAKVLRWLLALPGGDKRKGLEEMLRAREGGQLLGNEADYQLHLIYLWYEQQPNRALDLLRRLGDAHPHNPRFPQLVAEIEDVYLHDPSASLRTWRTLLQRAQAGTVAAPAMAETRARLGMALQLDRLFETDKAVEELRTIVRSRAASPTGALAQAQLQLGQALDRLGSREDAVAAYRAALDAIPPGDPANLRDRARAGLRRAPDPQTALAYRLSLEGWRAAERGALADADHALTRALALRPDDQVARYRQARLRAAEKNETAALDLLETVIGSGATTPATIYAEACVDAARIYERRQAQARAIELYQRARSVDGADERTRDAAARGLARLTAAGTSR